MSDKSGSLSPATELLMRLAVIGLLGAPLWIWIAVALLGNHSPDPDELRTNAEISAMSQASQQQAEAQDLRDSAYRVTPPSGN